MTIRTALPVLATLIPAALILAACAGQATERQTAAAAETPRQCFFARNVSSFRAVSDTEVMLRVGVNDYYRAELFAPCPEIRFTEGVGLRRIGGGFDQVCGPLDAEFIVRSPSGPRTCALNSLHKLSDAEVAALGPREKP